MKIATVLGTRPEIIRLSRIIPALDEAAEHTFIFTGQNYDSNLSDLFFKELGLRAPDIKFETRQKTAMQQIGQIMADCETAFKKVKPDRVLILGDTNTGYAAVVAKRMGIPVFHMEAGNRCFDDRVPEEVNRRVIDHSSDILMPYTERSRSNLLAEGFHSSRIYVTGNPIREVLQHYRNNIEASDVLSRMGIAKKKYFLITLHRAENVDEKERLRDFADALRQLSSKYNCPVICSVHPRTRAKLQEFGLSLNTDGLIAMEPFGLFDFVHLEQNALCVLSDSGTVQEECCLFNVPNVTLRDVTERPETVECGSNFISGCSAAQILTGTQIAINAAGNWIVPQEYMASNVSNTVLRILTASYVNL